MSDTLANAFTSDPRLPQLTVLLRRLPRFNILRTLGLNRQEVRHSDLLAVLLDRRAARGQQH